MVSRLGRISSGVSRRGPGAEAPAVVDPACERWSDALWAGFHEAAGAALRRMIATGQHATSARAAYLLNCWLHAEGMELESLDALDPDEPRHGVMIALDELRRGETEAATRRVETLAGRHVGDADLRAHLAGLQPDVSARVAQWNELLAARSAAPIEAGAAGFGDLRSTAQATVTHGPLVTVIVPVWNASTTLAAAVGSLTAQSYENLEIVLVDDASSDGSGDLAREVAASDDRIRVIRREVNGGAYRARNDGWRACRGELITVHDADDWAHPERIERQVAFMAARNMLAASGGYLVRVDPQLRPVVHGREPAVVVGRNTASLMYRREVLEQVGAWDERVRGAADYELRRRVEHRLGVSSVAHVDKGLPMVWSLRHPGSLTSVSATGMRSLWHIHGARRQYVESFEWRNRHRERGADFVVPAVMCGGEAMVRCGVVVTADVGEGSKDLPAVRKVLAAEGSVCLVHVPSAVDRVTVPVASEVWELIDGFGVRLATAGETLRCDRHEIIGGDASELGPVVGGVHVIVS